MDQLDDLEALVDDAAGEAGVAAGGRRSQLDLEDEESGGAFADQTKAGNRTVVRRKKKKKKKRSSRRMNATTVARQALEEDLLEVNQDALPVLEEQNESEMPPRGRGAAVDDIEKMAEDLNITPEGNE